MYSKYVKPVCSESGCSSDTAAKGKCQRHYDLDRWADRRTSSSPLVRKTYGRRRYSLNEKFFETVNTEEKAYWLGFITADGCVSVSKSGVWVTIVDLAKIDTDHLDKLKSAVETDQPLHPTKVGASLRICSKEFAKNLVSLGVIPRKTGREIPWNGPDHLMRHYWRGMVDGDGSITVPESGQGSVYLVGSKACTEAFRDWCSTLCGTRTEPYFHKGSFGSGCWAVNIGGNRQSKIVAAALYENSVVFLNRKKEKADKLISQ